MTEKCDLLLMMMALFSEFGREVTDFDVDAWHLVLGEIPREELALAIRQAAMCCESLPPASGIRQRVLDRRVSQRRNMTSTTLQSMRIAGLVKEFRRSRPEATADDVTEFVSQLERRMAKSGANGVTTW
jgi:hypothetical protein